jgi:4-aminobutyrate aminotransferase-like enzyme
MGPVAGVIVMGKGVGSGALKTLEIIERDRLPENAERMGCFLRGKLADTQKRFPKIGDIRGAGLEIGVELVKDPVSREPRPRATADAICATSMEKELVHRLTGHRIIKSKPALTPGRTCAPRCRP